MKNSFKTMKELELEIDVQKSRLAFRAGSKGIWENFGQKEARELEAGCSLLDYYEAQKRITAFLEWAESYEVQK